MRKGGAGDSCMAEIRTSETIADANPATPLMQFGDRIRIEMRDQHDASIFGTIYQVVEQYEL